MFELYWKSLGLPLSRWKGRIAESAGFPLAELLLWAGLAGTLLLLLLIFLRVFRSRRPGRGYWAAGASGPLLLCLLASGQQALPIPLVPTAWRTSLAHLFPGPPLSFADFQAEVRRHEAALADSFSASGYASIDESTALSLCDEGLDSILSRLRLPPGRTVRSFKDMQGLTRVFGLAYGGPAYHDPLSGEMAIVRKEDYPTPRWWRLSAACHEAAHAKGFTRELDAEILTQLVLSGSRDSRLRRLGDLMYLSKSGMHYRLPDTLETEARQAAARRVSVRSDQPVVSALERMGRRLGLRNDAGKYGSRRTEERWNPEHPFFTTIHGLSGRN